MVKQVVDDADIQVDKEKAIDDELSEKESDEIVWEKDSAKDAEKDKARDDEMEVAKDDGVTLANFVNQYKRKGNLTKRRWSFQKA